MAISDKLFGLRASLLLSIIHENNCSEPKEERKAVETTPGYSLMVLFNNRGAIKPRGWHTSYLQYSIMSI